MKFKWDMVFKMKKLGIGEYVRLTIDIPHEQCFEARMGAILAELAAGNIPIAGTLVAYQFRKTAEEIFRKDHGFGVTVRMFLPVVAAGIAWNEVESKRPMSDVVEGPFSDFRIEIRKSAILKRETGDRWKRCVVDLNMGSGGAYLYLQCKPYASGDGQPITEVTVVNSRKNNISTPAGFVKVPTDLNKTVGGDYIYLYYKKGTVALKGIGAVAGNSSKVAVPVGYKKNNVDLNKNAGGKFIYICYKNA